MPDTSAPFAFVADIIIENGKVRMLELGDLHSSGLDGYDALHGGDLHRDVSEFTDNITHPRARDDNATLMACCNDKGMFYALFADACAEIFPKSRIYPFYKLADQLDDIAHDFAEYENIVIKTPTDARGIGIHMHATADIALRRDAHLINTFSVPDPNPLHPSTSRDAFIRATALNAHSHFVIQALTEADPIDVNGEPFAPVMRVVMVAAPNDNGTLTLHHKGAYFKLPPTPVTDTAPLGDKYISKISDDGNGATIVPNILYESVQTQLNQHFLPALERAYFTPATTLMDELLHSNDTGKYMVALNWFTHHTHVQLNPDESPERLINRIDTIIDTTPAALRFMAVSANKRQSWHRDLKDIKERYRDLLTDTYDGHCALNTQYLLPLSAYSA